MIYTESASTRDKNRIAERLINDDELVRLLTRDDDMELPALSLLYHQIFPYDYNPDTVGEGFPSIYFDYDVFSEADSKLRKYYLYFWIIIPQAEMRTERGVLRDIISDKLIDMFDGERFTGMGGIKFDQSVRCIAADRFRGRCIRFIVSDLNRNPCRKNLF